MTDDTQDGAASGLGAFAKTATREPESKVSTAKATSPGATAASRHATPPRSEDADRWVGQQLREAREASRRPIEEYASRLKVPVSSLHGLESGDHSGLPGFAFALALTRSYARLVEIDPGPLALALRDAHGIEVPQVSPATGRGERRAHVQVNWPSDSSDRRSWWWAVIIAVLVLLVLIVWRLGNEPNGWFGKRRAASEAFSGAAGAVGTPATPGVSASPGVGGPDTLRSPAGEPVASAVAGASNAELAATLAAPANALAAAASESAAATLAAVSAPSGAVAPGPASTVPQVEGGSSLDIRTRQDTWMSVKQSDGKELFSGVIHAGESQRINGERPYRLVIGNMAGIESMTLGGAPVDLAKTAGTRNNVARLNLP